MDLYEKLMQDPAYPIPFTYSLMFEHVMKNEEICRGILETILKKEIGAITYLDTEHRLTKDLGAKSIVMDVYVKSEDAHYDIECQVASDDDLAKRIRYHQALMDTKMLDRGKDYVNLKTSYIIFLCLNDPFKKGWPDYVFRMECENGALGYDPFEMHWMMLNACAWQNESDSDTRALLKYLKDGKAQRDPLVEKIDTAVKTANANIVWREEAMGLMTLEHEHQMRMDRVRRQGEERLKQARRDSEERLEQARRESEERIAQACRESEERLKQARCAYEERLVKAQHEGEERLARVHRESEERLAQERRESEERIEQARRESEERIAQACREGEEMGESRFSKLARILLSEGRADDLLRASEDTSYLHELYEECDI